MKFRKKRSYVYVLGPIVVMAVVSFFMPVASVFWFVVGALYCMVMTETTRKACEMECAAYREGVK